MSEISETQRNLYELMNDYEMAVIGENRGRNRSGYNEKAEIYYQKRRELREFVAELEAEVAKLRGEAEVVKHCGFEVITEPATSKYPARKVLRGRDCIYVPKLPEVQE